MSTTTEKKKDTVTVRFPAPLSKDEQNYVLVGWQGKMYKIRKGEDVEVPVAVANIIKDSQDAKDEINRRMYDSSM